MAARWARSLEAIADHDQATRKRPRRVGRGDAEGAIADYEQIERVMPVECYTSGLDSARFVGQRGCLFHAATSVVAEANASRGVRCPWRWMSHWVL